MSVLPQPLSRLVCARLVSHLEPDPEHRASERQCRVESPLRQGKDLHPGCETSPPGRPQRLVVLFC